MESNFEPVHSVDEYYDGPRAGVAEYQGRLHHYRSVYLDSATWNADEDRFELRPVDATGSGELFLVRGEFRVREPVPDLPAGVLRPLEVRWWPVE